MRAVLERGHGSGGSGSDRVVKEPMRACRQASNEGRVAWKARGFRKVLEKVVMVKAIGVWGGPVER